MLQPDESGSMRLARVANRLGIDAHPNDRVWRAETTRLRHADPAEDADLALKRGDYRLVGLWGDGDYYPGVQWQSERYDWNALLRLCGTWKFEDTSDAIESDAQWRYIFYARKYAEEYNTCLINGLDRLGKLPPPDSTSASE